MDFARERNPRTRDEAQNVADEHARGYRVLHRCYHHDRGGVARGAVSDHTGASKMNKQHPIGLSGIQKAIDSELKRKRKAEQRKQQRKRGLAGGKKMKR
jgi:hypothetical protein